MEVVEKKPFKRLSKAVRAINYQIKLHPNFETFQCSGEETIDIEVNRQVTRFTIHSVDIDIFSVKFISGGNELEPQIVYKKEKETATFLFPQVLPEGPAKVHIVFTSIIGNKLKGFYRIKYKSLCGEERFSAVTQFATTHARRAFPCFDEPALKATFQISMVADKDKVVLSNMDTDFEEDHGDGGLLKIVHFNKTPIMSTYLVAFAVGEFDFVESTTTNGVKVRVYTPCGKEAQGKFALDVATKTLPFYSDYFGITYPLPKLDLLAVTDLEYGAMENWGLVTYRERCLLIDPVESSASVKEMVALVVGHELAHQWFGNITTMEWWTHLWLNEGFASWIEYLSVDHCCPEYNIWSQFVSQCMAPALSLDALENSHPIEVPCGHPSEIEEIFDAISYCKGSCILNMLHSYIGSECFRAGLKSYLTQFKYRNAETADLWQHLEKASAKPIARVMNTWTQQMGYPVLSLSSEKSENKTILKISQKKFSGNGSTDSENSIWAVPISLTTSKSLSTSEVTTTLLNEQDMVLFLDGGAIDWIKLNAGQVGFYRTLYSTEMLNDLIPAIKLFPAVDRVRIENDLFALSIAGYASMVDFLKLLSGYVEEMDFSVWSDIISNLIKLGVVLQYTEVYNIYKEYIIELCRPVLEKLGMQPIDGEDHKTSLLRSLLLQQLGICGDASVITECQERFQGHTDGTECIAADLRDAVYCTVAAHGNDETIDKLFTLFRNSTHMEEKKRIGASIGKNENPHVIDKVLTFALSDEVPIGETLFLMQGCTSSLIGRRITWKFLKDNWEVIFERYSQGVLLTRFIQVVTKNFTTQSEADDIQMFFKEHNTPGTERTINQSLERIEINRKWFERDGDHVIAWLTSD